MLFNTISFLFFLLVVVVFNYKVPFRYRTSLLIFSSFIFIGFFSLFSLLSILVFSIFNFYIAKKVPSKPRLYFVSILVNVLAILLNNYLNISNQGAYIKFSVINFNSSSYIAALGLSFYSLQNIAYVTDVYHKRLSPPKSILNYVLYNSFFPKVTSGPLMFPNEFISQQNNHKPSAEMIVSGINRFIIGLLKKMIIADRLFPVVNAIFDDTNNYNGFTTMVGVYLFTIQLYFDFSGYTDMALGVGRMLGYELKENFYLPFRSISVTEFWRRWHISLINWFSNYIYFPLVYHFRKFKNVAVIIGITSTFLVSAIWHGMGLTFLLWALCHVVFMLFELKTKSFKKVLLNQLPPFFYQSLSIFLVFNAVSFSNIFFRASSVTQSFKLIKNIFSDFVPNNWLVDFIAPLAQGGTLMAQFNFFITLLLTLLLLVFESFVNKLANEKKINIFYFTLCIILILVFGVFTNGERFIYMQF